jgi:hypothetical protein
MSSLEAIEEQYESGKPSVEHLNARIADYPSSPAALYDRNAVLCRQMQQTWGLVRASRRSALSR